MSNEQPTNTELATTPPSDLQPVPPPSQPTNLQPTRSRPRRGRILGPLFLIGIGVLLLLANLGYIPGSFWLTLIQFWPLLLILAGIEILVGGSRLGQLIVLLIGLLAIGAVVWYMLNPSQFAFGSSQSTTTVSQPIADVQSANVELNLGVGELKLGALDGSSPDWIQGTIQAPGNREIRQVSTVNSGVADLKISTEGSSPMFGNPSERWDLNLSPGIPINLDVDAGVGGSTLDLNALNIVRLDANTGVGGLKVVLPAHAGTVTARLEGGVGGLTVLIPQGVPARIHSSTGVGGLSINQSRFPKIGEDLYESPAYATATDRIDLSVDSGVGGITIP